MSMHVKKKRKEMFSDFPPDETQFERLIILRLLFQLIENQFLCSRLIPFNCDSWEVSLRGK